jgi:hypothetical protein
LSLTKVPSDEAALVGHRLSPTTGVIGFPMLLRHLRYFASDAYERHFARATASCNPWQPILCGPIATYDHSNQ